MRGNFTIVLKIVLHYGFIHIIQLLLINMHLVSSNLWFLAIFEAARSILYNTNYVTSANIHLLLVFFSRAPSLPQRPE